MLLNADEPIAFDDGFRLGDVEVYPTRLAIVKNGATVRLEPKVMAVLVHLARRAGEVVTRNEFADEVWRGRVVSDEVLSRDISILRAQLGDSAKEPAYVLTIPRVGYRLIAAVRSLRNQASQAESHAPKGVQPTTGSGAAPTIDTPAGTPLQADTITAGSRRARHWLMLTTAATLLGGLLWALWHALPSPALERTKIAVLPFTSLSEGADDDYFGDGLSEEIMHALGGVRGVSVVAKTSSFSFRRAREDIRAIGRKLGAGSLLEGSVRRDGDRLRITAQLIDANTGMQNWSETYDRRMSDIFEVQNEISRAIARRLVGTLAPDTRRNIAPTTDIQAYTFLLRANHLMRQRGAANLTRAIELFQAALVRDPKFGRAYAGLAEAYTLQPSYTGASEQAAHRLALAAVARAEALGEGTAPARGVRAFLHFRSREWQPAKDDFEAAIAASPADSDLLQWHSQFLASVGWMERAGRAAEDAVRADPLSPVANQRAGVVSLWTNNRRAAGSHFAIASEVGIQGPGLPEAWIAFLLDAGRNGEARTSLVETQRSRGQSSTWVQPAFAAMANKGSTRAALAALLHEYTAGRLGVSM